MVNMVDSRKKGSLGERKAIEYLKRLGWGAKRRVRNYKKEDDLVLDEHPQISIEVKYGVVKTIERTMGGQKVKAKVAIEVTDYLADQWRIQATEALLEREADDVLLIYKPYKSQNWIFGYYNDFGVWCWSTGEQRHRVILPWLISREWPGISLVEGI